MKKTLIASTLAAVMFVPTASAIEIYKDEKNSVAIGGFIDARIYSGQGETEIVNGASRINFAFDRQMNDGWATFAKFEWGVNPFGNSEIVYSAGSQFESQSDDFLNNRLGYVGVSNDTYGSISLGKQWGVWYDVVAGTNYPIVWDGNAAGVYTYNKADGAINGVGRGDKTIQYRNSFDKFSFGAQVQLKQNEFDIYEDENVDGFSDVPSISDEESLGTVEYGNTFGLSAMYQFTDELSVGIGYNTGKFEGELENGTRIEERDEIYGLSVTYGNWDAEGIYFSANYNENKFHDTDNIGRMIESSKGVESLVSYRFDNNIRVFLAYNMLDADNVLGADEGEVFKRQFTTAGIHYIWDTNTILYFEGRIDSSDFRGTNEDKMKISEDDGIGFGIRYIL
ncbi:porin [Shewanella sp. 10N.286.52.C2]|uniref:porin n=1 Tax=Shewanella sp. 10N.286.52.C2 TaxID=1880838 RepID=UPI000C829F8F|nr:porin [Shewanella sp. 10N.286.52.C2]PMG29473.1 porin [Shewanella sp. 10N.286.52.C2]